MSPEKAVLALGLLIAIVALLAVPLEVAFRLEGIEALTGRLTFRWLFGLVRIRAQVPRVRAAPTRPAPRPEGAADRARPEARARPGRAIAVLRQGAFRRRVQRLVGDLVRAAHLRRLCLRVRLGLGDPADTGRLWAVLGPLGAVAMGLRGANVRLEPEFLDPVLEFQAHGRALVIPLQLLALLISFALSPASIRAWRTLRAGRA